MKTLSICEDLTRRSPAPQLESSLKTFYLGLRICARALRNIEAWRKEKQRSDRFPATWCSKRERIRRVKSKKRWRKIFRGICRG